MKFQKLNLIIGWITFAIASSVYIATIEPTASFWDCGEFIATGCKLEVGHPPGAPFFMLMTNFFSHFAGGDVTKVAMWANIMSALASGGTILFLFWTITHLAKKLFHKKDEEMPLGAQIAILGSAFVGSLAYTFSDTFWFSAVEGEVYASSSLLTAFVFWAILKWEDVAEEKYSNRWLVLIAYIIGLSIGVHLLNLLTIPAIALVYYFKKYSSITPKGIIYTLLASCVILGGVMWGIIPGIVKMGFFFDRIFVNGFGLAYNSGLLFMIVMLAALFTWGIIHTQKKDKPVWNTILLSVAVMLIGYGSYAVTVVRSLATPPIDQNDPEDAYSLLSYLNREQYGSSPLVYGQYYNTPIVPEDPYKHIGTNWIQKNGKYVESNDKVEYNYNKAMCTFFPRMWSSKQEHIEDYKFWGEIKGHKVRVRNNQGEMETMVKPTFGENLRYFFRYQCGFMYWRYFMWNFVGRQNDIQGDGDNMSGNWISGIKFLDESRLGPQDDLPSEFANNPGTNKYYFLPLILGLLGLFYQLKRDKCNFWVVMALFILTGLAIVVYLNQYPRQPRERDYAYAGSFYAFAIWIGLGVLAVYEWLKSLTKKEIPAAAVATAVCLFIPGIMCAENWDDHDRSNRYVCHDVAWNYLNSCKPNAIIFTNGDNDTFPLWYIQEVEGVRTDVRVICLPYLITDWYIDQMKSKYYESDPVPFSFTHDQYESGTRDQVPVYEKIKDPQELKDVIDFVGSDNPQTKLMTNYNEKVDYFPTKKLKVTIDKDDILAKGVVPAKDSARIVNEMSWSLASRYIMKNDMMILDLVANSNWDRPIYFVSVGPGNDTNIRDYFQCEGFAYRLVPIKTPFDYQELGYIDTDVLYDNMMNKFRWGNMGDPKVYLDENIRRTLHIVKVRNNFGRLAMALQQEGKADSANVVIDRALEVLPPEKICIDYYDMKLVEALFACKHDRTEEIARTIANTAYNDLLYYAKLDPRFYASAESKRQMCMINAQMVIEIASTYKFAELEKDLSQIYGEMYDIYSGKVDYNSLQQLSRK